MKTTLRTTTLLTGVLTLGGLLALLAVSYYALVAPHFQRLEREKLAEHCARVGAAVQAELAALDRSAYDWAAWDDTYAYVHDRDGSYARKNLIAESYSVLNINILALVDEHLRVVYTGAYDLAEQRMAAFPAGLLSQLTNATALARHARPDTHVTGLVSVPEGVLLAASRPVITSREEGPVRGALLMGRWLDGVMVSGISARVRVPLRTWRVDGDLTHLTPAARTALDHLRFYESNRTAHAEVCCADDYALLHDINAAPVVLLQADTPRSIYHEGVLVSRYYMLALLVAGVVFCVINMLLLERLVVARVARLSAFARAVAERGDLRSHVTLGGADELTQLAADINGMLRKLVQAQEAEQARIQHVAQFSAELVELARYESHDYPAVRRHIITRMADLLGVARVSVWSFSPARSEIECDELLEVPSGAYSSGTRLRANDYPAYFMALQTSHIVAAHDAQTDARTRELAGNYLVPLGITALMDVPVRRRAELAGVVSCEHVGAPRTWSLEEQEFAAGAADLIALAFESDERRRVEAMLRENQRRLTLAQQFARIGTWDWDLRTGRDLWSPTTKEIFGVTEDEDDIVFMKFVHPNDKAVVERAVQQCIDRGVEYNVEHRIVRPDGAVRWVAERGNVVRDEHGAPLRMLGLSMDITERRNAQAALAAEKERLTVTLRSIADGVITTDTEGRVVLLNKVAEQLTGWSQAEAAGRPLSEVFRICTEETRTPISDPAAHVLRSGTSAALDDAVILMARDGTEKLISDSSAPIRDQHSTVIGAVVVFSDVSVRRRVEQEMLRAEKLQSIGILAGGIAHDFNNILTVILGNISLARMQADSDEALAARLAEAEQAITQAMGLTQQLLTFSKGGAPVRKPVDIAQVVTTAARFVCRGSSARCEFVMTQNLWPVIADSGQLSQVIHNLVINALQAMNGAGELEVGAENVVIDPSRVHALQPGRYVRMWVRDGGVGIPREHLARIFDPYFSTKPHGSGLGLAVTYSIIKNHHGHVEVESEPGHGSTFSVFVPAAEEAPAAASVMPAITPGGGRVLLVDDEEEILTTTGAILTRLGYAVATARDGRDAVRQYRDAAQAGAPFDVVILDLTVPGGLGGREALEELRAVDPEVVAIASSGYSNDPVMAQYRTYGFAGVLTKPYTLQELSAAVRGVIRRGRTAHNNAAHSS